MKVILNDYIEADKSKKDLLEFAGLNVIFIFYNMKDNKFTLNENSWKYIIKSTKVTYVKYHEDSYN